MTRDHLLGWPPALNNIDAPLERPLHGTPVQRPRRTEVQQFLDARLDQIETAKYAALQQPQTIAATPRPVVPVIEESSTFVTAPRPAKGPGVLKSSVRDVCVDIVSRLGGYKYVKKLFKKYGADNLSEISDSDMPGLFIDVTDLRTTLSTPATPAAPGHVGR